ncbi:MAG: glycosyltransferase family 4 protein [Chloroflexota bacterium]|nr:glycosyltransferase family 4 protein [Chloroflexota bacterium]
MRILFLATWFPFPPDNGSKIRDFNLLRELGRTHDVTLVAFAFDTATPDRAEPLNEFCTQIEVVPIDPFDRGEQAEIFRFLSPAPIVDKPVPEMEALVEKILRDNTFDAVIASTTVMATYALQARNACKILQEHNFHTIWTLDRYQNETTLPGKMQAWVSLQKRRRYDDKLFSQFDLCAMVSERDRDATLRMLPRFDGPVAVVPNGVDCQHNHPGLAGVVPDSLIYNGALTYYTNHDAMAFFLSEVFPLVRQQVPQAQVTITGSTKGVDVDSLPLGGGVHLSGYVDDIRPLVAAARVCIVPLRLGGGSRLKVLEAMALGTPVVATKKGAEGLDVVDGKHILVADSPLEFASATIRLLQEDALRDELSANARQLVEQQYDWSRIGQQFVSLVEQTTRECQDPERDKLV